MLLQLQPPGPHHAFQVFLTFPDLTSGLPNPPAFTTQITSLLQNQLDLPNSMYAFDKGVGITTLLEAVKFDMRTLRVRCEWVDAEVQEWNLVGAGDVGGDGTFLKALEGLLRDVNMMRVEEERWKTASEQHRKHEDELLHMQSRNAQKDGNGGRRFSIRSPPSSMKLGKHKRQKSFLKTIVSCVGSFVNLTSLNSSSPSVVPTRPPLPSSSSYPISLTPLTSTSSLPLSVLTSSFPSSPTSPTTPDSIVTALAHYTNRYDFARARLRASLVDLYRRFVLSKLSSPSHSRSTPIIIRQTGQDEHFDRRVSNGHILHNYNLWVLRSMLRKVEAELEALSIDEEDIDMDDSQLEERREIRSSPDLREKTSRGELINANIKARGAGRNNGRHMSSSGVAQQQGSLRVEEGTENHGDEDTLTFSPTTMVVPSSFSDESEDEDDGHGIEIGDEQRDDDLDYIQRERIEHVEADELADTDVDGDNPSISSHISLGTSSESTFSASSLISSSSAASSSTTASRSSAATNITYPEDNDDSIKSFPAPRLQPPAKTSPFWNSAVHSHHSTLSISPTPSQQSSISGSSLSYTHASLLETKQKLHSLLMHSALTAHAQNEDEERMTQMLEVRGRRRAWSCGELRSFSSCASAGVASSPFTKVPSPLGLSSPFRSSPLAAHSFTATDGEREGWEYSVPPNPHPIFHGYAHIHRRVREGGFASFVFGGPKGPRAEGHLPTTKWGRQDGYAKYEMGDGWDDEIEDEELLNEIEDEERLRQVVCLDDSWNSEATLEEDEDVVELGHGLNGDPEPARKWRGREEGIYDLPPRPRVRPTKNHPPPARLFPVTEEVEEEGADESDTKQRGIKEDEEFEFDHLGRLDRNMHRRPRRGHHNTDIFEFDPDLDDILEDQFDDDIEEGWGKKGVLQSPEFDIEMGFWGRCQLGRLGNRSTCHQSRCHCHSTPHQQHHPVAGSQPHEDGQQRGHLRPRNHHRGQKSPYPEADCVVDPESELGPSGIRIALDVERPTHFNRDIDGLKATRTVSSPGRPRLRTNSMYKQRLDGLGSTDCEVIVIGSPPSVPCVSFSPSPPTSPTFSQPVQRPSTPAMISNRLAENSLLCQPVSFVDPLPKRSSNSSANAPSAVDVHVRLQVREFELAGYGQFTNSDGRPLSPTSPPNSASSSGSCCSDCSSAPHPMSPPSVGPEARSPISPISDLIPYPVNGSPCQEDNLIQVPGTWESASNIHGEGEGEEFTLAMDVPDKKHRMAKGGRSHVFGRGSSLASTSTLTTTITKGTSGTATRRKGIDMALWDVPGPGPLLQCQ